MENLTAFEESRNRSDDLTPSAHAVGAELQESERAMEGSTEQTGAETAQWEAMISGKLYDPSDPTLSALRLNARKLARRYNQMDEDDPARQTILRQLLSRTTHLPELQAPVWFDYGCNTSFGRNSCANFHLTCLDVCPIHIGDNVMIGPNVTLAAPMHPLLPEERNPRQREDGSLYNLEYGKPIRIEDDCWLASNVVVCGGVTIGRGSVIGAGSVVTRDIPPNSLAAGNPCQVIREITEEDRMDRRST